MNAAVDHPKLMNEAILINGLSKKFSRNLKTSLKYGVKDIFSELTVTQRKPDELRQGEFWALNNINLVIQKGEAVGLVGANGSGKTTLLRVISGLIKPDAGEVTVKGRVVPLIALGAGFNIILTGRENIYVNLAILGLSSSEIEAVFDDIVAFAEIGDALDAPVQTYSSGMAARLGFSCAVHAKADILLIDEVLSVGDMRFRSKCYRRLADLRRSGTAFILVSHNTNAILSMCDRAVFLKNGQQISSGEPYIVMNSFEEDLIGNSSINISGDIQYNRSERQQASIKQICLAVNDTQSDFLLTGQKARLRLKINIVMPQKKVICSMLVRELGGESETILHISSEKNNLFFDLDSGFHILDINFIELGLTPGLYTAKIYLHLEDFYMLDAIESFVFRVKSEINMKQCLYYQNVSWELINDKVV